MKLKRNKSFIYSYFAMRKLIGIFGLAIPVIMILGGFIQTPYIIQSSISNYYYTNMRDIFVGMLIGVGVFLITYKGYDLLDDIVTNLSGVSAFCAAIFPTCIKPHTIEPVKVGVFQINDHISGYIHITFAALFFLSLAFNSIFLFTKTGGKPVTRHKLKRNIIYITCGIVIVASMVSIIIFKNCFNNSPVLGIPQALFFESISLIAFGISWLVKGKTLPHDVKVKIE